jgi:cell division protein FtsB
MLSSAITAGMLFFLWSSILTDLEKSFTNLKTERNMLKNHVDLLTANLEEWKAKKKSSLENIKPEKNSRVYSVNTSEINEILVQENKKLHVRCDMLEEVIKKIRDEAEAPIITVTKSIKHL